MDPPLFSVVTAQLLDESRLINKPEHADSSMALFGTTSKKRKFNPSGNRAKTSYNKATAKCTHCKSFHEAVDCWILHPELARPGWTPPTTGGTVQGNHQNDHNAITFMTVQANSSPFPMLNDMSYEPYTHNQ